MVFDILGKKKNTDPNARYFDILKELQNAIKKANNEKFRTLLENEDTKELFGREEYAKNFPAELVAAMDSLLSNKKYGEAIGLFDILISCLKAAKNNVAFQNLNFLTFPMGHKLPDTRGGSFNISISADFKNTYERYLETMKNADALERVKTQLDRARMEPSVGKLMQYEYDNFVSPNGNGVRFIEAINNVAEKQVANNIFEEVAVIQAGSTENVKMPGKKK